MVFDDGGASRTRRRVKGQHAHWFTLTQVYRDRVRTSSSPAS
jgi:hypothetical protein